MRLHRFFIKGASVGEKVLQIFEERLLHQWKDVFRFKAGDRFVLFNGSGKDYVYEIDMLSKKGAELSLVEIHSSVVSAPTREIWLFMAAIKKDLFELVVEKTTELGVTHIVPVISGRTIKKELNMERLQKIAIEASEQSGRDTIPEIYEAVPLEDALKLAGSTKKFAFDPTGEKFLQSDISQVDIGEEDNSAALFIGPEGGWTESEIEIFKEQRVEIKNLGQNILRAETAAIATTTLFLLL